jgi:hypothetical protein
MILDLKYFQESFVKAPPLSVTDIIHTLEERAMFSQNLIATMIVAFGGELFKKFENDMSSFQPHFALLETELYPHGILTSRQPLEISK